MYIEITKIKFKNFMSYQETSEFYPSNGVILINGKNGQGKSTILEAIYYGLFGKPFRKINNGELINLTNKKDLEVELDFNISGNTFKIIRGQKPNKFEIFKNNEIILQDSKSVDYQKMLEEKILKTNESVFKQLVLLGANIPTSKNFSELSNKEREELFKYIIDIGIFSEYSEIAKNKLKDIKSELSFSEKESTQIISFIKQLETDISKQEERNKNFQNEKDEKITNLNGKRLEYLEKIEKINNALETFENTNIDRTNDIKNIQKEINEDQTSFAVFKQKLDTINKLKQTHNVCIGCEKLVEISGIDVSKEENIKNKLLELSSLINDKKIVLTEFQNEQTIFEQNIKKLDTLNSYLISSKQEISNIDDKIKIIQDLEPNEIDYNSLKTLKEKESEILLKKTNLEKDIVDYLTFIELMSDKALKGQILGQSLPIINKWINYFLEKFGNFPFLFTINNDLTETIITMDGSNFEKSFNSLSNGQKLRIVFSILFSFLKFSEERNTTHFNILFLDEVLDSSLDSEGRLELINILRTEFTNRSINIISHNPEIRESEEVFENIYEIKSNINGSYLTHIKGN